uniref:Choline transporter-like protein n=1 Tax=Chrysotila carterae TaxID=13221 RepID=A0A7S4F3X7_CHRCT
MACGCCRGPPEGEVFKPRSRRGCTDILCLVLFIGFWIYMVILAVVSINREPQLIDDLIYPPDSYGNNCGKPGSDTADLKKVIYPNLDEDIIDQYDLFLTGRYFSFKPTKYCAAECPTGFSLANPLSYGGSSYPVSEAGSGAFGSPDRIYYAYKTQDVLSRCFPTGTTETVERLELCATPSCSNTTLNATLDYSVRCFFVESEPEATNVWRICGSGESAALCERQRSACELQVDKVDSETFTPHEQTDDSDYYTKIYASYVKRAVGFVEGLLDSTGLAATLIFGLAMPIVFAFVWAIFLRLFAALCVYTLLIAEVVVMILVCVYLSAKAGWLDDAQNATVRVSDVLNGTVSDLLTTADEADQTMYSIFAAIAIIVTVLNILLLIIYRRCISRLIAIIEECTKVFKDMFYIVLWPLGSLVVQAGVFVYGLVIFYFLFYVWDSEELYVQALFMASHVYGILWTIQLVRATTYTSMAHSIAYWYVSTNAPGSGKKKCCPRSGLCRLLDGLWTVVSRHLGSMIFGAAIIAIVQLLQLIMGLIDYATKDQQKKNYLIKLVVKCAHCCLYCLRKTVEFIAYYGFVFVAIEGVNFCRACKHVFFFTLKNPAQTLINQMVQKLLGMLIGFTTPALCALVCFYYLENDEEYKSEYEPLYVAIVVLIASFIVMDAVLIVFSVAVDTIYLCAFKDMEENNPPKYMSNDLRKGFGFDEAQARIAREHREPTSLSFDPCLTLPEAGFNFSSNRDCHQP